jgi:hypothetical protein
MSDETEVLAAPSEAAPEEVISEETQAAPETAEPEGPSEAQKRRERRKAQEQRILDEKQAAERRIAEAEAKAKRVQDAVAGHQEPKESDYPDIAAYWAALGAFNYARNAAKGEIGLAAAEVEKAKQDSESVRAAQMQALQANFADERREAATRYVDFDAALAVAANARIVSQPLAEMVLSSDLPADLAYYLGKNPEVAQKLSRMPPLDAARELGRIEAGLTLPQPKIASNAPPPINPVKPSGSAGRDPAKMTASEYAAWRASGGTF